ncbi:MAG: GNAT family N-acetyltransferase [Bacteroidia bacterium]|nr:GNAT family N-acetyltransferase [Bacteroidia bacterium]
METSLILLNRFNWENYLSVEISPEQGKFCPSFLYSLAQAYFENIVAFGINYNDAPAGFIMYGDFTGIYWINRLAVDFRFQRKGIARNALKLLLEHLSRKSSDKEIRTSFSVENIAAQKLFFSLGFEPVNTELGEEIVAVWNPKH